MNHIKAIIALLSFSIGSMNFCATPPASATDYIQGIVDDLRSPNFYHRDGENNGRMPQESHDSVIERLTTYVQPQVTALEAQVTQQQEQISQFQNAAREQAANHDRAIQAANAQITALQKQVPTAPQQSGYSGKKVALIAGAAAVTGAVAGGLAALAYMKRNK